MLLNSKDKFPRVISKAFGWVTIESNEQIDFYATIRRSLKQPDTLEKRSLIRIDGGLHCHSNLCITFLKKVITK